jgi:hypothetical protein
MKCAWGILSSVACPIRQYFSFLSYKRHDFLKITEYKICAVIFSAKFVWNISHSKNNWTRYDQNCILVFMQITRYTSQILIKIQFSWCVFEKYSNIILHENPSSSSRVVLSVGTDITKLIAAYCNFANAPKNDSTLKVCLDYTQIYLLSSKVIPFDNTADASRTWPP